MSRYTFLRVEVDSDVVELVLGLTPGVEVVETLDGERKDTPPASSPGGPADAPGESPAAGLSDERPSDDDDNGSLAGVAPSGDMLDEGSTVREYGLLGVGISLVTLGIATVGIWWYRRRSGDESADAETPPPATEFDSVDDQSTPAPAAGGEPGDAETGAETDDGGDEDTETDSADLNLVVDRNEGEAAAGAEADDDDSGVAETASVDEDTDADAMTDTESAGRSGEREDVEWEPKWSDSPPEPSIDAAADASADESDESDESDDGETRPGESVDAAPLLGIAFIAVTGALVRWAKGDDQA